MPVTTQEMFGWLFFSAILVGPIGWQMVKEHVATRRELKKLRLDHKTRVDDLTADVALLTSRNNQLTQELDRATRSRQLYDPITGRANRPPEPPSRQPSQRDRDFELYRECRKEWGDSLEGIINQSRRIIENAPSLQGIRIACALDAPLLTKEAMANYLDGLDTNFAIVPGLTPERPLEVAVRHESGEWVLINEGVHELHFIDGKLTGIPDHRVQGVGRPDQPIARGRPRFGGHVQRQVGE